MNAFQIAVRGLTTSASFNFFGNDVVYAGVVNGGQVGPFSMQVKTGTQATLAGLASVLTSQSDLPVTAQVLGAVPGSTPTVDLIDGEKTATIFQSVAFQVPA